jgi:hypothetical protein
MTWYGTQATGTTITASDWNTMVDAIRHELAETAHWSTFDGALYEFQISGTAALHITKSSNVIYLNFNTISGESGYGIRDNNGTIEYKNSGGSWTSIGSGAGGGGTPGGSDTYVQFNDGGTFNGEAALTWNKTSDILTIDDSIAISQNYINLTTVSGSGGIGFRNNSGIVEVNHSSGGGSWAPVTSMLYGADTSKPGAAIEGRLYFATDTYLIYYDTGSVWASFKPKGRYT